MKKKCDLSAFCIGNILNSQVIKGFILFDFCVKPKGSTLYSLNQKNHKDNDCLVSAAINYCFAGKDEV